MEPRHDYRGRQNEARHGVKGERNLVTHCGYSERVQ